MPNWCVIVCYLSGIESHYVIKMTEGNTTLFVCLCVVWKTGFLVALKLIQHLSYSMWTVRLFLVQLQYSAFSGNSSDFASFACIPFSFFFSHSLFILFLGGGGTVAFWHHHTVHEIKQSSTSTVTLYPVTSLDGWVFHCCMFQKCTVQSIYSSNMITLYMWVSQSLLI